MSRVQFVRQMLPRICKDFYELEIYHGPTGAATFDPSITTSRATDVIWQTESGTTVTTGTTHDFSYTPTSGPHKCTVTVRGGLRLVTGIDCNTDAVTSVTLKRLVNSISASLAYNTSLVFNFSDLHPLSAAVYFSGCSLAAGPVSALPRAAITYYFSACPRVTGSLLDFPSTSHGIIIYADPLITAASIAHLLDIRDLRIYSMGWNQAGVDTVLLSASDAVWANAAHYTYIAPSLQIQSNAVPGGSAGADTTDPMTTPGSGNSNTDWQWDAGAGKHKALTGKAAIWFLAHNTGHAWIITYQMV